MLALSPAGASAGGTAPTRFPITIANCGRSETIAAPPQRAITTNEGATEIMLELGLADRMVGTAYLDDAHIYPPLARAYAKVPIVAKQYPSTEVVLSKDADFVYASYSSAFAKSGGVGTRAALESHGMSTYLSPSNCIATSRSITWDDIYGEITQIGRIFNVPERAARVVAQLEGRIAAAQKRIAGTGGASVFWYDSGTKTPTAGACCGAPGLIMRTAGARNIFSGLRGGWSDGNWEQVVAADPDVIVLVDATWDTLASKRNVLSKAPLSALTAVKHRRFVIVPFGSTTPSFRDVDAVVALAKELEELRR